MSDQMPVRIWATEFENRVELWTTEPKTYQYVFIRSDIAERMAEALDRALSLLSDHHDDPAAEDGWENEEIRDAWMGGQAALSAFRSATQDTEARHE